MKKIILWGTGRNAKSAFYKLKDQFEILYFVSDNSMLCKTGMLGIEIISLEKLAKIYCSEIDIIVCSKDYFRMSAQLIEMGITDYYVMLEGFLYHTGKSETMMPVELNNDSYFRKKEDEKNVLYVQSVVGSQACEIASMMKEEGYKVYYLYIMASSEADYGILGDIYSDVFTFYTVNGIIDFIENSDFDIVHSLNASDILTNIVLETSKSVVFNIHDVNSVKENDSIEKLTLNYIANMQADGNVYASWDDVEIAKKRYGINGKDVLVLENEIWNQKKINNPCLMQTYRRELADFYERVMKREIFR